MEIDIIGKYEKKIFFITSPGELSLLASGIRACSASEMPKVPLAW
jgi:hypothetical protein